MPEKAATTTGLTYTTRRGDKYFLHTGPKRDGGVQHFVSTKPKGPMAESVPDGFEIYETPNGRVFLRRKKLSPISDAELLCVRRELAGYRGQNSYQSELTGMHIIIHEAEWRENSWEELGRFLPNIDHLAIARSLENFMPVMRFVLQDEVQRLFRPERYCFRGSVDDWIGMGEADMIEPLTRKFIPHLGRESFYELY